MVSLFCVGYLSLGSDTVFAASYPEVNLGTVTIYSPDFAVEKSGQTSYEFNANKQFTFDNYHTDSTKVYRMYVYCSPQVSSSKPNIWSSATAYSNYYIIIGGQRYELVNGMNYLVLEGCGAYSFKLGVDAYIYVRNTYTDSSADSYVNFTYTFSNFSVALLEYDSTSSADYVADTISQGIDSASGNIIDSVESQYAMDSGDDLGAGDLQAQVDDKMGVLNFGADTLVSFLDLFNPSTISGTQLTFPAFSIEVGGSSYTVWNDTVFDLSVLEVHFGVLIDMLRIITVLCVWLAVLLYLVKAKEHFINGQGG